jgi:phage gpG-like protein
MYSMTLFAVASFLVSSVAMAQAPCGQRDKIVEWLAVKYKEAPIATGVSNNGRLVEVLTTQDGDTWTLIVTSPDGNSCLIASGQGWRAKPHEVDIAEPQA